MEKQVDKIVSEPTTKTTNILEQQLAQAAGAVPANQWVELRGVLYWYSLKKPSEKQLLAQLQLLTVNSNQL